MSSDFFKNKKIKTQTPREKDQVSVFEWDRETDYATTNGVWHKLLLFLGSQPETETREIYLDSRRRRSHVRFAAMMLSGEALGLGKLLLSFSGALETNSKAIWLDYSCDLKDESGGEKTCE